MLKSKYCPNCQESNKPDSRICVRCKMILSYTYYSEVRNEDKQKITNLETDVKSLKDGINKIMKLIQLNPVLVNVKPAILKDFSTMS